MSEARSPTDEGAEAAADREAIIRSVIASQALAGIEVSYELAARLYDEIERTRSWERVMEGC